MSEALERVYSLLARLNGHRVPLAGCIGRTPWPKRGVYFFREPGEYRASEPGMQRIVRVGTHGVSANATSTLWGRLRAHRGRLVGGGNHRGSVFRRHVGEALHKRDGQAPETWGHGSSAPKEWRDGEDDHERRVSAYLGRMTVEWVDVPDEPGPRSERAIIESNLIALLSNGLHPSDPPSASWLGHYAKAPEISGSGLWNVKYVRDPFDPRAIDLLEAAIDRTVGNGG